MQTFILILAMQSTSFAHNDSNALQAIPGFKSQKDCIAAGVAAQALTLTGVTIKYACVAQ